MDIPSEFIRIISRFNHRDEDSFAGILFVGYLAGARRSVSERLDFLVAELADVGHWAASGSAGTRPAWYNKVRVEPAADPPAAARADADFPRPVDIGACAEQFQPEHASRSRADVNGPVVDRSEPADLLGPETLLSRAVARVELGITGARRRQHAATNGHRSRPDKPLLRHICLLLNGPRVTRLPSIAWYPNQEEP